jgi:hypothetical protein
VVIVISETVAIGTEKVMVKYGKISDPPSVLGNDKVVSTRNQSSRTGGASQSYLVTPAPPGPTNSLTFLEGRSFIAPNSNLARAIVMGNEASIVQSADTRSAAQTTIPAGEAASISTTRDQKPVSNLTVLLNQHDNIRTSGDRGESTHTCRNSMQSASHELLNDLNFGQTREFFLSKEQNSVDNNPSRRQVFEGPKSASPRSSMKNYAVTEADSASGPPPSQIKALGSSAPSRFPKVVPRDSSSSGLIRVQPPRVVGQHSTSSFIVKSRQGNLSTGMLQQSSSSRVRR